MLPISRASPVIEQPVILRAWAALPAAGAWDAAPIQSAFAGYKSLLLFLTYQRAGAGGAFEFKIEASPYAIDKAARNWFQASLYTAGTLAAGSDTQSLIQREYIRYTATGAAVEAFLFGPVDLAITVERFRITAREAGAVATPGSLEIVALLGMEA